MIPANLSQMYRTVVEDERMLVDGHVNCSLSRVLQFRSNLLSFDPNDSSTNIFFISIKSENPIHTVICDDIPLHRHPFR
jgi:hypothetical protein